MKKKMVIAACSGALTMILGGTMLATHIIVKRQFRRRKYPDVPTADLYYRDYKTQYSRTAISFPSGKNRLQGYIYGEGNNKGLLVFAHGIGSGHEGYIKEILWMVDHGWRVLAYDATGSCESEGKGTVGLVQSALDLDAALTYVEKDAELSKLPICLMGHSWGGYAVTAGLSFGHDVKASVSISGYADPVEMMMQFATTSMSSATAFLYPFVWLDEHITFGKHASLTAVDGINQSNIPVMLIHGTEDGLIPLHSAAIIGHADQITNRNVVYRTIDWEGQNGHSTVFRCADSLHYIEKVNADYRQLYDAHGGNVPLDVRKAFIDSLDKALVNRPNEPLLQEINSFLNDVLQAH